MQITCIVNKSNHVYMYMSFVFFFFDLVIFWGILVQLNEIIKSTIKESVTVGVVCFIEFLGSLVYIFSRELLVKTKKSYLDNGTKELWVFNKRFKASKDIWSRRKKSSTGELIKAKSYKHQYNTH